MFLQNDTETLVSSLLLRDCIATLAGFCAFFFFSVKLKISTFVELFKTVESVSFLLVISVFMLDRANRIPSVCVCMHVFHKLMRE